jgi:DNA modification methylase
MNVCLPRCKANAALQVSAADIEQWKGSWILSLSVEDRRALIERALVYWRLRGFPFPVTSPAEAVSQLQSLRRSIAARSADHLFQGTDTNGLRLANSYHPQMWSIRGYGRKRSPIEYFEDDQFLARVLERAPRFWPNRSCWNAQCVRSLFRIASPGRVANFRPMVAAGVIRKFCPPGGRIVDFCSGYGGRLVAAIACGAGYIGIDASSEQIAGSRRMAVDLRKVTSGGVSLVKGSAPEMLAPMKPRSADLVFTSPPYFDKERYGHDTLQSYIQFRSYDDWLQGFLRDAILQTFRLLKAGGFLVLNVADSRRFPLAADTRAIMGEVFGNVAVHEMRMRRLPSYGHFETQHRAEQILVSLKQSSAVRPSGNRRRGSTV